MSDECAPACGLGQASVPEFLRRVRTRLLEQTNVISYTPPILRVLPDLTNVTRCVQAELREHKTRLGVPEGMLAALCVNPETEVYKYLADLINNSDGLKHTCLICLTCRFKGP